MIQCSTLFNLTLVPGVTIFVTYFLILHYKLKALSLNDLNYPSTVVKPAVQLLQTQEVHMGPHNSNACIFIYFFYTWAILQF